MCIKGISVVNFHVLRVNSEFSITERFNKFYDPKQFL